MSEGKGTDFSAYTGAIKRRFWLIAAIFTVGSVASAGVAYVLPPVYESTAKILVETQQIPDRLAESTVTASAAERLQLIEQRLMTRDNLLDISDKLALFEDKPGIKPTEKVAAMRQATRFQSIAFQTGPANRGPVMVSAFTITYATDNAQIAARVANEFVTRVLEQNLQARSERASTTQRFFNQEVEGLASELLALENEIARFKNENADSLPESYEFRLSQLAGLEEAKRERQRQRALLEERRNILTDAMREGTELELGEPQSPLERELAELESLYLQNLSSLSESHPQMQALAARIEALKRAIEGEAGSSEGESDGEPSKSPQQRAMEVEIQAIDRRLVTLDEEDEAADQQIIELKASLERTPQVQLALSALQRRYENLQLQYEIALRKLAEAETGLALEVNRQAERFEVIEQALVPEQPVAPKRKLIAIGGATFSLIVGLGLALLLELGKATIRTSSDMQRKLGLRPVITVPYIATAAERTWRRTKWVLRIGAGGAATAAALWAVDQYYLPLDLLWSNFLERSGIGGMIGIVSGRL